MGWGNYHQMVFMVRYGNDILKIRSPGSSYTWRRDSMSDIGVFGSTGREESSEGEKGGRSGKEVKQTRVEITSDTTGKLSKRGTKITT